MPNDVGGGFAHKILFGSILPNCQYLVFYESECQKFFPCNGLLVVDTIFPIDGVLKPQSEAALGVKIELAQQGSTPGSPQDGIGGADISHRQCIEIVQMYLVANGLSQFLNYVRIANVSALGSHRHQKMLVYQPAD